MPAKAASTPLTSSLMSARVNYTPKKEAQSSTSTDITGYVPDDGWAKAGSAMSFISAAPARYIASLSNGSTDAVLAYASVARWIMAGTEYAVITASVAKATVRGVKAMGESPLASTLSLGTSASASAFASSLVDDIASALSIAAGVLFAPLFFFAFLLPAMPFLFWVAAVVGWVILCVEAVVAAPLWIVGHAIPEGEGFAGAGGRAGYTLFLSVLLRPLLLVLGMFICMIIMASTGWLIAALFNPFVDSLEKSAFGGILTAASLIMILGLALTIFTYKLFSMMTSLPDRIIRWVGQLLHNLGDEGQGLQSETISSSHTGAAKMQGMGAGVLRHVEERGGKAGNAANKDQRQNTRKEGDPEFAPKEAPPKEKNV
jgi:conjugal transfer/type IV secretion protein DotA/TraY